MRPDRLVVGEVRDAEALDLLLALNTGVPAHANDTLGQPTPTEDRPRHADDVIVHRLSRRKCRLRRVALWIIEAKFDKLASFRDRSIEVACG
ncbi:MAG: pilus assembly protein CpaF [Microbacterium sp.]|jgi:Flp pilus assembly CpaF family ATPase|nr:pilus assembly protein CpaF [Microbacterium sp.]